MSICILADANDIDRAKNIELEYMSVDDLKKRDFLVLAVVPYINELLIDSTRTRSSSKSLPRNTTLSLLPKS
jgi:hypothetical protein